MRIGIDCRLAGIKHAGLGRYIQQLATSLVASCPKNDWVLFFADSAQAKSFASQKNVTIIITPVKHYTLKEQCLMSRAFLQANLDLLHVPHFNVPLFYPKPFVVTIHDLLWHEQKGTQVTTLKPWVYWPKYWFYKLVVNHAVTSARKIFVPSQTVAQTLIQYYQQAAGKIIVTYEGVELVKSKPINFSLPTKYLLYVGSLYPHKNVEFILPALKKTKLKLVVVSSRSAFNQKFQAVVKAQKLESEVKFLGQVSDGTLHTLYQKAYALIQPSLSEGFGLTGIEAMKAKTAVLASDIPVFHEIYRDGAIFFQPTKSESLLAALKKLGQKRPELIVKGQKVSNQYHWQKTAEQTLAGYEQALAL